MPLKFANNQSLTSTTALPAAVPTDNLILISTQTASNSAYISFTTGLDSTYDAYEFKFIDIHPRTDNVWFQFNMSTDSGSTYVVTKTSSSFFAYHDEADTVTSLTYESNKHLAQSTGYQIMSLNLGNDTDEAHAGSLQLFNPSSTTYVKHYILRFQTYHYQNYILDNFIAGYGNTTSAINAIRFQTNSGNFDGIIKMYGVKKS